MMVVGDFMVVVMVDMVVYRMLTTAGQRTMTTSPELMVWDMDICKDIIVETEEEGSLSGMETIILG